VPVSVPVRWYELETLPEPADYIVDNVRRRLAALEADQWEELASVRQSITTGM